MNLEREQVVRDIATFRLSGEDADAKKLLKRIAADVKKAEKEYTDIKISVDYDHGDCESPADGYYIVLTGKRLETEEEWHVRLSVTAATIQKNLEAARKQIEHQDMTVQRLKGIEEALKKSSLKCSDCGCPTLIVYTSWVTRQKTTRLCSKCYDKRKQEDSNKVGE
jgi:hypothetical protein